MYDRKFWNELAKRGSILGVVMLASRIVEQQLILSGTFTGFALVALEFLVASGIYIYLLYRYTKSDASTATPQEGYSFIRGWRYIFLLSLFASIIVGAGSYIYVHGILGYNNYIEQSIEAVNGVTSQMNMPSNLTSVYTQMYDNMRTAQEPTIYQTLFSTIWAYTMISSILGLILAAFIQRSPKIFE